MSTIEALNTNLERAKEINVEQQAEFAKEKTIRHILKSYYRERLSWKLGEHRLQNLLHLIDDNCRRMIFMQILIRRDPNGSLKEECYKKSKI